MKRESQNMLEVSADKIEEYGDELLAEFLRMMARHASYPESDSWVNAARDDLAAVSCVAQDVSPEERSDLIDAAAEEYGRAGYVEIDSDAFIIKSEAGQYWVQAWLYVETDEEDEP